MKKMRTVINHKILISIGICVFAISTWSLVYSNDKGNQSTYINAVNAINGTSFDSLKKGEGVLSNGTHIKIESSINYPADRVVYYKNIVLSVENNNGFSRVVTAFDSNGKEISFPTNNPLTPGDAVAATYPFCASAILGLFAFYIIWPKL